MARVAITPIALALTGTTSGTLFGGSTVDVSNGNYIDAVDRLERYFVVITANGTAGTVTFVAGTDDRHAFRGKLGDQAHGIAIGEQGLFVLESARFAKPGNDINIDYSNLNAANIAIYKMPPET